MEKLLPYKPLGRAYTRGAITGFFVGCTLWAVQDGSYWWCAFTVVAAVLNDLIQYGWEEYYTDATKKEPMP